MMMSEVQKIWDDGARVYDECYSRNVPYHKSHDVIADLLPKDKAINVLDLGSGTGAVALRILERIPEASVACLEFSSAMVAKAEDKLASFSDRVEFICADLREWAPPSQYDAIVTCNALVYKELNLQESYRKYARCLVGGGIFLNSTVVSDVGVSDEAIARNLANPNAPDFSEGLLEFSQGAGRAIASFGPDSLAVAYSVEEHLAFMTAAGLAASVPWQYLTQAVVLGVSNK
jgi:ubiquinone/menaquinone biosynthesis C-methylase UbiE